MKQKAFIPLQVEIETINQTNLDYVFDVVQTNVFMELLKNTF